MIKIIYIGNSNRVLDLINQSNMFSVDFVISQKGKLTPRNKRIKYFFVEKKQEVLEIIRNSDIKIAIMYSFGIILPQEVFNYIEVYNYHPGDLSNNRGSSPINWAILLNFHKSTMTLHKANKVIDDGTTVIGSRQCDINKKDTVKSLTIKTENLVIPLLKDLNMYLQNNLISRNEKTGIYRKRIVENDYTIKPLDAKKIIRAKIQSQKNYFGAICYFRGKKYYIKQYGDYVLLKKKFNIVKKK